MAALGEVRNLVKTYPLSRVGVGAFSLKEGELRAVGERPHSIRQ
jgi:hypothetical protein